MNLQDISDGSSGFETRNCIDMVFVIEGNPGAGPCPPELLKRATAERDKANRLDFSRQIPPQSPNSENIGGQK